MSNNDWLGFDPNTTEASESFRGKQEAIPNGKYQAVATSAVRKHTKSGNGWFWELTFAVAEGQYEGKTVLLRCNMVNASEEAAAIGRSQMRRYLDCINNLDPKDESDLCNRVVLITVECEKQMYTNRKGERVEGINNMITKIDPFVSTTQSPTNAPEQKSSVPPWKR